MTFITRSVNRGTRRPALSIVAKHLECRGGKNAYYG
jgi:hypothetical protein